MNKKDEKQENITNKVFDVIEKKGITPKPKWHFLIKEWFVWIVAFLSLFLGSVATTLTLYITNASRFMLHHAEFSKIDNLFEVVPFLWIALLFVGVFYTAHALRDTKSGYRWHTSWLVGIAIALSIFLGSVSYSFGIGEKIDSYLLSEMPFYGNMTSYHNRHWEDNNGGIITGLITDFNDDVIKIQRFNGEIFEVNITPESNVRLDSPICEGMKVRIIGTTTEDCGGCFEVDEITVFHGRGGMFMRRRMGI